MTRPAADTYRTLAAPGRSEIKRDGSRFIGEAFPARSEEAGQTRLAAVRAREHRATHHCWAWRLGPAGGQFRYDDDGEPTGTGGPPLLRQLEAREVTNALVVVTRYYGGTKLGTGGLARAYGEAARAALADASVQDEVQRRRVRLRFDYDDTGPARRLVERFAATVESEEYGAQTTLDVDVPRSQVEAFRRAFRNATAGRGESKLV